MILTRCLQLLEMKSERIEFLKKDSKINKRPLSTNLTNDPFRGYGSHNDVFLSHNVIGETNENPFRKT